MGKPRVRIYLMKAHTQEAMLKLALHVFGASRYFFSEANRAWSGTTLPSVDHAAHLNGAMCGVLAFAVARGLQRAMRHRRRRRPPPRTRPPQPPAPQPPRRSQSEPDIDAANQQRLRDSAAIQRHVQRLYGDSQFGESRDI